MTIFRLERVTRHPATEEQEIGLALYNACMDHFVEFLGQRGLGLSYDSCAAAVAIRAHRSYPALPDRDFAALYGSSRLFTGLDPDRARTRCRGFSRSRDVEHAEQEAILNADGRGRAFWAHSGHHHIYVDLEPCEDCEQWLEDRMENWYVHYTSSLRGSRRITLRRKRARSETFGRQVEPTKKQRT
ncbi:MAG TPA: hypothetical protein VGA70_15005 [Longimicrobiales bacterium]|jgi:hypothetical protein